MKTQTPKKYQDRVWSVDDERCYGNGIFVYFRRYWRSSRDYGQHVETIDTVREMQAAVRDAVPCDCPDCQSGRGWTPGVNS